MSDGRSVELMQFTEKKSPLELTGNWKTIILHIWKPRGHTFIVASVRVKRLLLGLQGLLMQ